MGKVKILTKEKLRNLVPSAFAEAPHEKVSDKYSLIKTIDVVDSLSDLDLYPVRAYQSVVRDKGNEGFQRHSIRFRRQEDIHREINTGDSVPELLLVNGHNGRVPISFYAAMFRVICGNGAVIMEQTLGSVKARHIGIEQEELEELVETYASNIDDVLGMVDDYKKVELNPHQKNIFAKEAHAIAWPNGNNLDYSELLKPKRDADMNNDLWTTFNVVQENIVKGGIEYQGPKRKTRTRAIKSIQRDTEINIMLWALLSKTFSSRF